MNTSLNPQPNQMHVKGEVKEEITGNAFIHSHEEKNSSDVSEHITHEYHSENKDPNKFHNKINNELHMFASNDKNGDQSKIIGNDEFIDSKSKKRPFQCSVCQKYFHNSGTLKNHERIHTGEKPYECITCKKRFKRACHLKDHDTVLMTLKWRMSPKSTKIYSNVA